MLHLRQATPSDVTLITTYIKELAEFEKLSHECHADEKYINHWLFCENPKVFALMAEWEGNPAGFALYFYNFSTFLSKPGIYIEDVYIRPEFRRKGIAKRIFAHLAKKATDEGCGRLEWWVLNWNVDAIRFYEGMGAVPMNEWTVQRIEGTSLNQLATSYEKALI